ncbi:MAG: VIT1/CCC1 family predicted Fe2+/Mn2+ transporter [Flavobacterium sp.]|jgi:VIT1/CCC1 family predicted Fe2+/Mn2+ transporter
MKIFTTVLIVIAIGLIGFNITLLDFSKPMDDNSEVALLGILAALCAVFILIIFKMSKKIVEKLDR